MTFPRRTGPVLGGLGISHHSFISIWEEGLSDSWQTHLCGSEGSLLLSEFFSWQLVNIAKTNRTKRKAVQLHAISSPIIRQKSI